ncbi:MAG: hypothetical protein ACLTDR_08955 [Adlercreutzia equolifaciens]
MRWTTLRFDGPPRAAALEATACAARAADLLRSLLFDYDAEHDADFGRDGRGVRPAPMAR